MKFLLTAKTKVALDIKSYIKHENNKQNGIAPIKLNDDVNGHDDRPSDHLAAAEM